MGSKWQGAGMRSDRLQRTTCTVHTRGDTWWLNVPAEQVVFDQHVTDTLPDLVCVPTVRKLPVGGEFKRKAGQNPAT